jgi:hypothetical protein
MGSYFRRILKSGGFGCARFEGDNKGVAHGSFGSFARGIHDLTAGPQG